MKKTLAILLALAVVGGAAFAEDAAAPAPALKLGGYLNFGGAYADQATSAGTGNATWGSNGWDSGTGGRFQINGKFDGGTYGVAFRLREQDAWTANNTGALMVRRLYGWADAFNGVIRLQAGRLGDYSWATGSGGGWNAFGNVDGPVGLQLQIKPIEGLNLGAFVPVTGVSSGLVKDYLNDVTFGAAYYLKGIGDVEFGYNMKPDTAAGTTTVASAAYIATGKEKVSGTVNYTDLGGAPVAATALVKGDTYIKYTYTTAAATTNNSNIWFGVAFTGMKDLTAYLEGQVNYLGDKNSGYTYMRESFDYPIAKADLSLVAAQQLYQLTAAGVSLVFEPTIGYSLTDNIKAEVTFDYGMNQKNSFSGWDVAPDVCFTLGGNSTVRIGGAYAGGDYAIGTGSVDTRSSSVTGVFEPLESNVTAFIDFVWNF